MNMLNSNVVTVEMNRRGVAAAFTIVKDHRMVMYSILAGRRMVRVRRNGDVIIDENDVGDPLHPTDAERAVIAMAQDFEGFEECLYDLACGLAILYNNEASDEYAADWLKRQVEERLNDKL